MKVTNCKFLKFLKIHAIVLYPFVLYCEPIPAPDIILHEQVHLDQIKRDGILRFYLIYLWEYIKGRRLGLGHFEAYRQIPYEQEAYQKQRESLAS